MTDIRHRIRSRDTAFWAEETNVPVDKLSNLCDQFFDDEDGQASHRIIAALHEYKTGIQGKQTLPSPAEEMHDLEQLLETLTELNRRLIKFPPRAEAHAFIIARDSGLDWFSLRDELLEKLSHLRSIAGSVVAHTDAEPRQTNPGKRHRNDFIRRLAAIFSDFTEYEKGVGQIIDRDLFINKILQFIGEQPPSDISKIVRTPAKS